MTECYQCKQMIGHPDSYRDISGYMMSLTFQVIEPTVYYIITICESKKIVPSTAGLPAEGYSVRRQVIVKKYNPLCAGMALRTLIGLLPEYKYLAVLTTK